MNTECSRGDKCEEVMYGGYSEHVGDPEIKKIEDSELAGLIDDTKTRESAREIRMTINEFADGKYDIRSDIKTEPHDVDVVENNKMELYNKHETIAKINKFLGLYLSKKTRSDVMRMDEL